MQVLVPVVYRMLTKKQAEQGTDNSGTEIHFRLALFPVPPESYHHVEQPPFFF